MNTAEKAIRPQYNEYANRTKRAYVWLLRGQSAYDLAARINKEPSTTEVDFAAAILDSVQRYALADAREWEMENSSERYCNSATHKHRQALLDSRREKLQKRLYPYRVKLVNYGLYPSIVDTKTGETLHFLHYFD